MWTVPTLDQLPEPTIHDFRAKDGTLLARHVHPAADGGQFGLRFFTAGEELLQVGRMRHPAGRLLNPHFHPSRVMPAPTAPQEVLFVISGSVRVSLYEPPGDGCLSFVAKAGSTIILLSGGHGFEILEDAEIFEVRHGPHGGKNDKIWLHPLQ